MTDGGIATAAAAPGFPAPGSSVPGAPPPLKRPLTPADGVPLGPPTPRADPAGSVGASTSPVAADLSVPPRTRSPLIAAAAMAGIAVGLELAGLLSGRGRDRRRRNNFR
jgi:hypothetical protein